MLSISEDSARRALDDAYRNLGRAVFELREAGQLTLPQLDRFMARIAALSKQTPGAPHTEAAFDNGSFDF
jgi:hypothetical protein